MIDWNEVDTLLLDMDGTLLDLHFDDFFWREHVPARYAQKYAISLDTAKAILFQKYSEFEGTLEWYCVDFWSRELGLDIPILKTEVDHLISVQPFVIEFLDRVRACGKRSVLVTNAHGKSLSLKMGRTKLGGHLDTLVCAHDLGLPKEDPKFWEKLVEVVPFDPRKTALIDDSLPVLESAKEYGINYLIAVLRPNLSKPFRCIEGFPAIASFQEIFP